MASRSSRRQVASLLGDPKQVVNELRSFRRSARILSSHRPRLIDDYRNKWVAIFGGQVKASAVSFDRLMASIDRKKLPRENLVIRYIDNDERIMIL